MARGSSSERLRVVVDGSTMQISLNRPEKLNALDSDLVEALIAALDEADKNSVRLVVFIAEGKGFSGGFDFTGINDQSDGDLALRFLRVEHLLQSIHYAPYMTLALVHGPCFGAAADLVASCTHRIAAPSSKFRMPGLLFGIALGTRRLAELLGRDAALDVLSRSKVFNADEALEKGMLTAIAEPDAWEEQIASLKEAVTILPEDSFERLLRLTRPDYRDADMAALARSVSAPGLKDRIKSYLASMAKAK